MQLLEQEIFQVAEMVWMAVLNLPIERQQAVVQVTEQDPPLACCVHISGEWEGTIILCCSEALAHRAAAVMFGTESYHEPLDRVRDAVGELANMVGGNVKALLPGPSRLSLPALIENADYQRIARESRMQSCQAFSCEGEPFLVTLFEKLL